MTTELGGEQAAIPAESTTAPPRRAQLVMGEPLGGSSSTSAAGGGPGGTTASGETAAEISNDELLVELPDSTTDLELTHLRLKTLRGLNLQRFTAVQVSSTALSITIPTEADDVRSRSEPDRTKLDAMTSFV